MNPFQPWQDTIPLLAGAKSLRPTRPGEAFETQEQLKNEQRVSKSLLAHAVRLLTLLHLIHP
jgi:hypothetical protein